MKVPGLRFKVPSRRHWLLLVAVLFAAVCVQGQGTFQNLNFESANNLPAVTLGQAVFVPVGNAFPGWTVYEGGTQQSQLIYNGVSLGAPLVTLVGTNTGYYYYGTRSTPLPLPLAGNYSASLDNGEGGSGTAALAQTGFVPGFAKSLQFIAAADVSDSVGYLSVSFNGQNLPLFMLTPGANYDLYGCDISVFAGQTGELRFTENLNTTPIGVAFLDNIAFSNQPVPEPATWLLLVCGAGLIGLARRQRKA